MSESLFITHFWISTKVVYLALARLVLHETAAALVQVLCTYNHAPCHFMQSHIRMVQTCVAVACKVHVCLAVTCHLHFRQSECLRAESSSMCKQSGIITVQYLAHLLLWWLCPQVTPCTSCVRAMCPAGPTDFSNSTALPLVRSGHMKPCFPSGTCVPAALSRTWWTPTSSATPLWPCLLGDSCLMWIEVTAWFVCVCVCECVLIVGLRGCV